MSSIDNGDDPSFLALSSHLRRRIDSAFDSVALQSTFEVLPGGFIVEESEPEPSRYEPGGFIIEDLPPKPSGASSHILFSQVPRALNLLDLSPDDDVIGVFKNAATGWGAQNARSDGVSRKDWRAVCAALLEGVDINGSDEENLAADEDVEMGADSGLESDEYQMEELSGSASEKTSSDEYEEPDTTARAKKVQKVPARTRTSTRSSETEISRQLTESQKAQCRQEFSRFFPHVPDNELDHQRITIKDIARVAELLKENLKTEEILDMLEAFSSSPDKSMNLADFERMMIATKLV